MIELFFVMATFAVFFAVLSVGFFFLDRWHQRKAWRDANIAAAKRMAIYKKKEPPDLEDLLREGQEKLPSFTSRQDARGLKAWLDRNLKQGGQ